MVQDVFKDDKIVASEEPSQLEERLTNLERVLNNLENTVRNLEVIANVTDEDGEEAVAGTKTARDEKEIGAQPRVSLSQILGGIDVREMQENVTKLQKNVSTMRGDLKNLREKVAEIQTGDSSKILLGSFICRKVF